MSLLAKIGGNSAILAIPPTPIEPITHQQKTPPPTSIQTNPIHS